MSSTFDKLPNEIQQMVFEYVKDDRLDNYECMLVCSSWKRAYLKIWYSRIDLHSFKQLKKLLKIMKKDFYLNPLVKKLTFQFKIDYADYNKNMVIAKLFTLLPNLEFFDCLARGRYFRLVLDAVIAKQLPRLNYVGEPIEREDIPDYTACSLLLKDRLKNLVISDWVDERNSSDTDDENTGNNRHSGHDSQYGNSYVQFYRLFDKLDQFKYLEILHIERSTNSVINLIELTTDRCPSLQHLSLDILPSNINVFDNKSLVVSELLPTMNLRQLKFFRSVDDPLLLLYIIGKFPRLLKLELPLTVNLNESILDQLLEFVVGIKDARFLGIPFKEDEFESLGSLWEAISENYPLIVQFEYQAKSDENIDKMDIVMNGEVCTNGIFYSNASTIVKHTQHLEKHGHCISCLVLSKINLTTVDLSQQHENTLYKLLILHPLKHCPNLNQLIVHSSSISGSDLSGYELCEIQSFDYLCLINCVIESESVYQRISKLIARLNILDLSGNTFAGTFNDNYTTFSKIDMPETAIGTLKLSAGKKEFNDDDGHIILLKLTMQEENIYFIYNFNLMNDLLLKRVSKKIFENYQSGSKHFTIGVRCKSLEKLEIEHLGQKLKLSCKSFGKE